jgi:hypothetical protein
MHPSYSQTNVSEQTLSSDMLLEDKFQPGSGLPVGKIQLIWGEAFIFHRDPTVAYRIQAGMPVYAGDIIHTRANAWVRCRLIDGSQITLAPDTDLTVGQSICSSARKTCSSFIFHRQGYAHFMLTPPADLTSYEFKVQTDFAAGTAKGAEFVVTAAADVTRFGTLEKSRMEVTNLSQPEEITFLSEFQKTAFSNNIVAPTVETVPGDEIEVMLARFFPVIPSALYAYRSDHNPESGVSESQLPDE